MENTLEDQRTSNSFTLQVGVKAILADTTHGKFVAIERSDKSGLSVREDFDIPGGRIAPNESPLEGLVREIREEIGLELTPEPKWELLTADPIVNTPSKQIIRLTYLVPMALDSLDFELSDEHVHVTILPLNESERFHPLLNDAIREVRKRMSRSVA